MAFSFKEIKLKFLGKFFLKIFIYFSLPSSNLFTLPSACGFESCFEILVSIKLSIFFSILNVCQLLLYLDLDVLDLESYNLIWNYPY